LAKEAGDASTAGSHRTCSNGRSREDNRGQGFLKETHMLWMWIEGRIRIITHVEDLDIWQEIVGTE